MSKGIGMLLIYTGILLAIAAIAQLVMENGARIWKHAFFWMMLVTASVLSVMAISTI